MVSQCHSLQAVYHKDRLKNSVFLSLSVCAKRSIVLGQGNLTDAVYKDAKQKSSVKDSEQNKHQLFHRLQSVRTFTNLQYVLKFL